MAEKTTWSLFFSIHLSIQIDILSSANPPVSLVLLDLVCQKQNKDRQLQREDLKYG